MCGIIGVELVVVVGNSSDEGSVVVVTVVTM